tara:strand:+ start:761 stop:1783 length:1023 start_codon:yes stop_codon:yes gene_type:complete
MQEVKFEFPDPDQKIKAGEVDIDVDLGAGDEGNLEIEGNKTRENMKVPGRIKAGEVEIEIEDDTPKADRGRKPSTPPEDVTDDELENYSEKVKTRIKHFSKGYHDERRAKETAMREQEALTAYAKKLVEENNVLKGKVDQSTTTLVEQAKKVVANELDVAKRQYKDAYEMGDTDAIIAAQEAIATATIRADKVANYRPVPLQPYKTAVQVPAQPNEIKVARDERATTWADDNTWFGADDEMTSFALGLDIKLKKSGVDPRSDEYYEKINSRMREVFPEQFDEGIEDEVVPKKKSSNVVAPATRSTGPTKIRLTQSQVSIARKLGVPLDKYAMQAALLREK